jgi:hypothetical protein
MNEILKSLGIKGKAGNVPKEDFGNEGNGKSGKVEPVAGAEGSNRKSEEHTTKGTKKSEEVDLSNKKCLVYDFGLFTEVANKLGEKFGKVHYFVPWTEAFPKAIKSLIGEGFENMERIKYFWDYVDEADLIVFPDTHCSDIVNFLRDKGYPVAGVGDAEELELDRIKGRKEQEKAGLPTQQTDVVKGLTKLEKFLKEHKKVVIKLNTYRGDVETWSQDDWEDSEPKIARLKVEWGPKGEELNFVIEEKLDGIEPGLDGILYKGEVVSPTMVGFEIKGAGYIGKVYDYKDVPEGIKLISDKMAPVFKKLNYSFWMSSELILTKQRKGFFIDPCLRLAAPVPNAVQQEMIKNYAEVFWGMGHDEKVIPEYTAKYGGGASFYSSFVEEGNWARIKFDKKNRQWIKFREACCYGGNYWAVPKASTICSVIGTGDTPEEVIEKIQEISKSVKAVGSNIDKSSADFVELRSELAEVKKYGIEF